MVEKKKKTRSASSSVDPATQYAMDVTSGDVVAGPDIRAACARHLRDLEHGPSRGLFWDTEAVTRVVNFFAQVLKLNGGEHVGKPFILLPWQCFIVGSLFGWKAADGTRRFRMSYIESGKGSGKSPLAGGVGLNLLMADKEPRAEIYAAATKKDQAMILFRDAVTMVDLSPALAKRITGLTSAGMADSIQGGADIEDLEAWRARVIERWYWTPQGGADGDYVVWAKEVPGVTRAWTYLHWSGRGTVGVMVANSDLINPIPDAAIIAAVQAYIEPRAPVAGADIYVFAPAPHVVNFQIRLNPDTAEVRYAVEAELRSMMLRDDVPEGVIKPSRVSEAKSIATGEYSHTLVSPSTDIAIEKGEVGVVGILSWT